MIKDTTNFLGLAPATTEHHIGVTYERPTHQNHPSSISLSSKISISNHGINKKRKNMKVMKSRETIVYLSPRKEGQNLRHQYCKGNLTDRDSRKYFRSLKVRMEFPSTPTKILRKDQNEYPSYMGDDENTVDYDSYEEESCQLATQSKKEKVT